jgi:hypothetical protein
MRGKRIALFFLTIAIGLGLGLLYGWVINPVKYEDTAPSMLHGDYKADYVLMVAEIYNADSNLEQASRRLALLDSLPPTRIVSGAILTARELGYAARDQEIMGKLALALQGASATLTPGGQP